MSLNIPLGFNTDTALKDARKLGAEVKHIFDGIDATSLNAKTLTFVKNITSAYYRMEKLRTEAERLGNTPVPTKEYREAAQELALAEKALSRLQNKQNEMRAHGETTGSKWAHLTEDIKIEAEAVAQLSRELKNLEANGMAYLEGTDTQAFKEKSKALNVQIQAVNILVEKFKEYAETNGIILNTTQETTEATKGETKATQDLQHAEEELDKSRKRRGVVRGPALQHDIERGISRGPALRRHVRRGPVLNPEPVEQGIRRGPAIHYDMGYDYNLTRGPAIQGATFLKNGQDIRQLSSDEQRLSEDTRKANEETKQQNKDLNQSSRALRTADRAARSFASTLLNTLGNAIRRVTGLFRSMANHLHSSHRSSQGLGTSMKRTFMTLMRYTLGIRSIFMLVRRIRGYVKEAFKVMAQEIPEVNADLSRLGHSFKELKAGFGTMLQPVLKALTPILDTILQKILSLMNAIGKFFATLTGQDYIYEATVANYDYADSVKEAENSLASFDKLNVISKSKNDLSLTKDTVTYKKVKINPEDKW